MSEATRSRWQWTWVLDDSVIRKYGDKLELVGTWWSGQHKRVVDGIDVLYYTTRVICKGQVTMEEMVFNVKHHWSSVDCQGLELYGIS
jgi:hypothetical protein